MPTTQKWNPNSKSYEPVTERDVDQSVIDKDRLQDVSGLADAARKKSGRTERADDEAPKSSDYPGDLGGFSRAMQAYRKRQESTSPQKKAIENMRGARAR